MIDYYDINDNELLYMIRENDEDAVRLIHDKYNPLITKKCSRFYKYVKGKGVEYDDLHQECLIGFEESINNYKFDDDVTFYTFTNICMDRQLMSLLKRVNRDKHKFLNEAVPLESFDSDSPDLINVIMDSRSNPEFGLINDYDYLELYDKIVDNLTDFEACVFELRLQNFDCKEIADILDKDNKSVYNAIQRIKIKVKKFILLK